MFWPIKGVIMPSLWAAVAGDRPVPNAHDDPGHVTWGWKDAALGKQWWYYAKVLRKKATLIALRLAPYFYALSENFGSPEEDYLDQYRHGLLTLEAKTVYETLLREGPLSTVALRKATNLTAATATSPFNRALDTLQADFKILPVGVAEAGAWRYAFVYDCVHRHYPALPEQARAIGISEAQRVLLEHYICSVGAAEERDVRKVFQWAPADITQALKALVETDVIRPVQVAGQKSSWFAVKGM